MSRKQPVYAGNVPRGNVNNATPHQPLPPTHAVSSQSHRPAVNKPSPLSQTPMNMNSSDRSSSPVYVTDSPRIDSHRLKERPTPNLSNEKDTPVPTHSAANSIPQKRKDFPPSSTSEQSSKKLQTPHFINLRPDPIPAPSHNEADLSNARVEAHLPSQVEAVYGKSLDEMQVSQVGLDQSAGPILDLVFKWSQITTLDKNKIQEQARLIYYHR